jgi:hypothetical protein
MLIALETHEKQHSQIFAGNPITAKSLGEIATY